MTINIRGKQYVTVSERVQAAHEAGAFEIIDYEIRTIGETGRWWYQVVIAVDGKPYRGTAEIKFDAPKGSPDATNPVECAETSAIGRALGFAGFGIVDGIASADEVRSAQAQQQQPQQRPAPRQQQPQQHTQPQGPYNPLADVEFRQRCNAIGYRSVDAVTMLVRKTVPEGHEPTREKAFEALEAEEKRAAQVAAKVGANGR